MPSIIRGDDDFDTAAPSGTTLISSTTVTTSVASVDFTGFDVSKYKRYLIILDAVKPATNSTSLRMRTSTDGGSTFDSAADDYDSQCLYTVSTAVAATFAVNDAILLAGPTAGHMVLNTAADSGVAGHVNIINPHETNVTAIHGNLAYSGYQGGYTGSLVHGIRDSAADVDALRFFFSSGNIASGTFEFYGIKEA